MLGVLAPLFSCSAAPPPYLSDEAEAAAYLAAIAVARKTFGLGDTIAIHPYLAVATDSSGTPTLDIRHFAYEPSVPLKLADERDGAIRLCPVDAEGTCKDDHVIVYEFTRVGDRDAIIMIQSVVATGDGRRLILNLRYRSGGWKITYTEAI